MFYVVRRVRGVAAVAALLLLAACGFEPLYATQRGEATVAQLAEVRVNPIPDRVGQVLRNFLNDRMEPVGQRRTRYTLDVVVNEQRADLGIQRDATITFSRLTLIASFVLRDAASGSVLLTGNARADNSYNQLQGGFSSLSAEQDARTRAAETVGAEIVTRLSLFLRNRVS